jgi:AcrR family transcriptional regulator
VNRKEQAKASRGELLTAARTCFTENGYDQTTVSAILDRAGMARGALYHYFPGGKNEIFTAVFDVVNDEYHRRRDALLDLPSAVERLKGGVRVFLELCADPSFSRIALADAPRIVPGQDGLGSSYRLLRTQITEAVDAGELPPLDIECCSMALYGAVRSVGEFVANSPDPGSAVLIATGTINVFIQGISAAQRSSSRPT